MAIIRNRKIIFYLIKRINKTKIVRSKNNNNHKGNLLLHEFYRMKLKKAYMNIVRLRNGSFYWFNLIKQNTIINFLICLVLSS